MASALRTVCRVRENAIIFAERLPRTVILPLKLVSKAQDVSRKASLPAGALPSSRFVLTTTTRRTYIRNKFQFNLFFARKNS